MSNNILSPEEKSQILPLNIKKIITDYPEIVIKVSQQANSFREILATLHVSETNTSARKTVKKFLQDNCIELPNHLNYRRTEEYKEQNNLSKEVILKRFINGEKYLGTRVRHMVIKYKLIPYHCSVEECLLSDPEKIVWNGQPITLDLDHIDGDNTNNLLDNLRWLCPNCHSQTETYKGKNIRVKNKSEKITDLSIIDKNYQNLPEPHILLDEIQEKGYAEISRKYKLSSYYLKCKLIEYVGENDYIDILKTKMSKHKNLFNGEVYSPLNKNNNNKKYPSDENIIEQVNKIGWAGTARNLNVSSASLKKHLSKTVDIENVHSPFSRSAG